MAKEGYPAKALIELLEKVAIKNGYQADKAGISRYERDNLPISKGKLIIGERYLENRYSDYIKKVEVNPEAIVNPRTDFFDLIAEKAGYEGLQDFLGEHGYPVKKILPKVKRKSTDYLLQRNPPHPDEKIDKYVMGARWIPTFMGLFPLFIFLFFTKFDPKLIAADTLLVAKFLSLGLVIGFSEWVATAGKKHDGKVFFKGGKKGFPTVYLMLYNHKRGFTEEEKGDYRNKVTEYFGIQFPTKAEESEDDTLAVQRLREAAIRVKNTIRSVVIRAAITKHGFHRNLIPASILGMGISICSMVYSLFSVDNHFMFIIQLLLFFAFLAYYLTRKRWLISSSEAYARYLIQEFLSR